MYEHLWKSMRNPYKSMRINANKWKSIQHQCKNNNKSMQINEKQMKSNTNQCHENP